MGGSTLQLSKIINIEKWQALQDSLSEVTGLAIIMVDFAGYPLTAHSKRRPFCSYVRNHPDVFKYCEKCDSRGGIEAARMKRPYIYTCHLEIVDVAIPIIVENQYIGAIMAGEIRLTDDRFQQDLEQILKSPIKRLFDTEALAQMYESIPFMTYGKLLSSVNMLFSLCNYIVTEAMDKNSLLNTYEQSILNQLMASDQNGNNIANDEMSEAYTNAYVKSAAAGQVECKNKTLQPAFDYIYNNRNKMLSQTEAAKLCHISPGHFSRLMLKETGENYVAFCARQKIEWAKILLDRTNLSISQISDELGFSDPSYFIKIFKKYEGLLPTHYRKISVGKGVSD